MRRGESKAKGLRRSGRTDSAATKTKTRAGQKGASATASAKKRRAKAFELNKAAQPKVSLSADENVTTLKRALAEADEREAATARYWSACFGDCIARSAAAISRHRRNLTPPCTRKALKVSRWSTRRLSARDSISVTIRCQICSPLPIPSASHTARFACLISSLPRARPNGRTK